MFGGCVGTQGITHCLHYVVYWTQKTFFDNISKHQKRAKYLFLTSFEVLGNVIKLCLEC